ncbi:hypothetical protein [Altererythrobacter sp. GH1-8]|uniref:hypothetical protein n=1 Tax=Altererythrobacter sp. GH1-8 TaxID=3349333 RepID=UPI00374C9D94
MPSKRKQPTYLQAEDLDTLARQNIQLMAELWIVKDRLAMLEDMLAKQGLIDRATFEATEPDEALSAELEADRVAYIKRIVGLSADQRTIPNLQSVAPQKRG